MLKLLSVMILIAVAAMSKNKGYLSKIACLYNWFQWGWILDGKKKLV